MSENAVISLNEVYKNNLMYYWCNAVGEINMPGYPIGASPEVSVLPNGPRSIYMDYRGEGRGANEYVVTYNGQDGLALQWLFDYSWLTDLGLVNDENLDDMKKALHAAVQEAAVELQKVWDCPVLLGVDTDPDGDEIIMFIDARQLWDQKSKLRELITKDNGECIYKIGDELYTGIEAAIKNQSQADGETDAYPECVATGTLRMDKPYIGDMSLLGSDVAYTFTIPLKIAVKVMANSDMSALDKFREKIDAACHETRRLLTWSIEQMRET